MEKFDSSQSASSEPELKSLEIQVALQAYRAAPSPQTREDILNVLKSSFVYVAVQHLPEHLRGVGTFVLQEDTKLVTLASTNAQGETRTLIFSDKAQVLVRMPGAESIAMSAPLAAHQALAHGLDGLVIDPAGYWVEFTRAETEALARELAL